jgi:hypothetical protein
MAADGAATRAIGRALGCTTGTASKWRVRYATDRLAGFSEVGDRGAEAKYDEETDRRILAIGVAEGVVAIDGKTSRRSKAVAAKAANHIVSAFAARHRLGQVKVADKANGSSPSPSCSTCWPSRALS